MGYCVDPTGTYRATVLTAWRLMSYLRSLASIAIPFRILF
jgi:hypothetical protein